MNTPKYTYSIESNYCGKWTKLYTDTKDFCLGYMHAKSYRMPRNAHRIVRSDGKVICDLAQHEDVGIGMVAGWPTPEQYEDAAKRAIEMAARIRAQTKKGDRA